MHICSPPPAFSTITPRHPIALQARLPPLARPGLSAPDPAPPPRPPRSSHCHTCSASDRPELTTIVVVSGHYLPPTAIARILADSPLLHPTGRATSLGPRQLNPLRLTPTQPSIKRSISLHSTLPSPHTSPACPIPHSYSPTLPCSPPTPPPLPSD